jgi:hypothetical protein
MMAERRRPWPGRPEDLDNPTLFPPSQQTADPTSESSSDDLRMTRAIVVISVRPIVVISLGAIYEQSPSLKICSRLKT